MILWRVNVKSDYRRGEGGRQADAEAMTFPLISCKGMEVHFSSCCLASLHWTSGISWDALYTQPVLKLLQRRGLSHRDAPMVTEAGPVAPVTGEATMQCLKSLVFFNEPAAQMHNSM